MKRTVDPEAPAAARLLTAAEVLFARHGVEATSVRQITAMAQVNVASVNYHFGSKDDLAAAVFERTIARVSRERLSALDRMVAEAGEGVPDLAAVVSSFIEPYLGDGNEDQGVLMARFILMHRLTPDDATRRIVAEHLNPLATAYVAAFRLCCPDVPVGDLFWRYMLMVSSVVLTSAEDRDADRLATLSQGATSVADRSAARDALVGFAVAGLTARDAARFVPGTIEPEPDV
ncbi:TetR/AcrR family transcriptional regulator [Oceanicola sp. 22II-s10i]|uniref:TetR/AcrR family transcriptional regulator n=1 Tax=Oceanicola sp. 22II-s10i TaxID=1317116 RepID=UPI001596072D|nr:TetR family transcriptional regulator [Oceanicola sp. 22II-s10i]